MTPFGQLMHLTKLLFLLPIGFDGLAEIKSEANSLLSSADLKATASTSSQNVAGNLKIEKVEHSQQPVLGAVAQAGENWKCGQCLAVFTSGMELFQVCFKISTRKYLLRGYILG